MGTKPQQLQRASQRVENGLLEDSQASRRIPAAASGNSRAQRDGKDERARALKQRLSALQREHNELRQAIFAAAQTQRRLCAPREVRRGRFEIASEIFGVRHLSGDFNQILDLGALTGLAVGDIVGKGLTAGLWLAHLAALVRTHLGSGRSPSEAVTAINAELLEMQPEAPMVALFLALLDQERGELIYCNAGQSPPFALHAKGGVEFLEVGGPVLGALPGASFTSGRAVLGPGDTLISYSDGIVECRNERGEEFGAERLVAAAQNAGRPSAGHMLYSLLGAAQDFVGTKPREDDLTLMVTRRLE